MKLSEIASALGGTLHGDPDCDIERVSEFSQAMPGSITLAYDKAFQTELGNSQASAFLAPKPLDDTRNIIVIKDYKKALYEVLRLLHPEPAPSSSGIHPNAVVDPTATVDPSATIGPGAWIGAESTIASGTIIHANASIAERCQVGADSVIFPNVSVYADTQIGNRVRIHSGSVIGADGFGFQEEPPAWNKIPHIGNVVIEDDVEIFANTCVDRGCLGTTRIGAGTKIDNLVQIGHNVSIGKHCAIVSLTGISGGITIEDEVKIAGQVGTQGHITIGKKAFILGRSGVSKDVPPGSVVSGYPAQDHRVEMQQQAKLRRLAKKDD